MESLFREIMALEEVNADERIAVADREYNHNENILDDYKSLAFSASLDDDWN